MDPINLIAAALALGAAAGLESTAEQAVRDAYLALKALIQRKYARVPVDLVEADPGSASRREVVKEDLQKSGAAGDAELLRQAQAVLVAVEQHAPEAAATIGVRLSDIRAAAIDVGEVLARGSGGGPVTGVSVEHAEITGEIRISGVSAANLAAGPHANPAPARPGRRTLKILFLAANPADSTRLSLDEESREIEQALRRAEYGDRFAIEKQFAVRVGDLQDLLLRSRPDVVHFSGHGSPADAIILEDERGMSQPVSATALGQLFALHRGHIRCVVLNACFSAPQAQAIAQSIDAVVGMSTAIGDRAAGRFAAAFYQALGYGQPIRAAFDAGCLEIHLANLGEQDTPQLLGSTSDLAQVDLVSQGGAGPKA